jgi:hypothetical protein
MLTGVSTRIHDPPPAGWNPHSMAIWPGLGPGPKMSVKHPWQALATRAYRGFSQILIDAADRLLPRKRVNEDFLRACQSRDYARAATHVVQEDRRMVRSAQWASARPAHSGPMPSPRRRHVLFVRRSGVRPLGSLPSRRSRLCPSRVSLPRSSGPTSRHIHTRDDEEKKKRSNMCFAEAVIEGYSRRWMNAHADRACIACDNDIL